MKITRRQLRRIIKEEFSEDLLHQEWGHSDPASTIETVYQNLNDLAEGLYGDGYDDIAGEILAQLELLEPMRGR